MTDTVDHDLAQTHLLGTPHRDALAETTIQRTVTDVFRLGRTLETNDGMLASLEAQAIGPRALVLAAHLAQTDRFRSSGVPPRMSEWGPTEVRGGYEGERCWLLGEPLVVPVGVKQALGSLAMGETGAVLDYQPAALPRDFWARLTGRTAHRAAQMVPWAPETSVLPAAAVLARIERTISAYELWANEILAVQQDRERSLRYAGRRHND